MDGWAASGAGNDVVRLLRPETVETVNGHTSERSASAKRGMAFQRPAGPASDGESSLLRSHLQG